MPTLRPRITVTESDELAAALDEAQERWPDASRSEALARLALDAADRARHANHERLARRRRAVKAGGSLMSGRYEPDYLGQLRAEWPE